MAHEVTVVGTSGGATPEVIGDAGVVVPGDDPLALAAALRRLAAADQRRPLAQAGTRRALQLFSDAAAAGRTLQCWKEVVSGTACNGPHEQTPPPPPSPPPAAGLAWA